MSKVNASTDFDRIPKEEVPRYVSIFCEQVSQIINGGIGFADNMDAKLITATFGSANTDGNYTVNLGRVPSYYILCGSTVAMNVFNGSVPNTLNTLTVQSSAAGTAYLLVF